MLRPETPHPYISEIPELEATYRLSSLERRFVSSKSPSSVRDRDLGVARTNGIEKYTLPHEGSLIRTLSKSMMCFTKIKQNKNVFWFVKDQCKKSVGFYSNTQTILGPEASRPCIFLVLEAT